MSGADRLWTLFRELVDLDPAAREARLATLDDDTAMRDRLRAMLAADDASPDVATREEGSRRTYPWPGDSVGAYRLIAPIGDGGMGSVWLANSRRAPDVSVAIKFPTLETIASPDGRARLEQEGRILACLDHPNIVPLIDAGETDAGIPFCVLRALHGRPLDSFVREQRPSPQRTIALIARIADALDHVHRRGFVHRDVKPGNVVVTEGDWPVLVDFGAARITDKADIAASAVTIGHAPRTPAFASPEQNREERVTVAADVYGLGALAKAVLADSLNLLSEPARRRIEPVVSRALEPEPEARFTRAGDFARALTNAVRPVPAIAPRGTVAMRIPTFVCQILLVVGIGLGVGWWLRGPSSSGPSIAFEGSMLSALEIVPSAEIPVDHKTLAAIARQRGSAGWDVAAAVQHARHGDVEFARATVLRLLEDVPELPDQRSVELAGLATQMGLGGAALALLANIDVEVLPYDTQHAVALLVRTNQARIAGRIEWDLEHAGDEIGEVLEELTHELEPDEVLELHQGSVEMHAVLQRIALGHPESVAAWLDLRGGDESPVNYSTPELGAFLELHARLLDGGHALPCADAVLREIERELSDRSGTPQALAVRAWAWCRALRVRAALRDDPERASSLAKAGVKRIRASAWAPTDLEARMLALQAVATARAQMDPTDLRNAAVRLARAVDPQGQGFVARIAAIVRVRGSELPTLTSGLDPATPGALTSAIREHTDCAPWWRLAR